MLNFSLPALYAAGVLSVMIMSVGIQARGDDGVDSKAMKPKDVASMIRVVRSKAESAAPLVRISAVSAYKKNIELKARLTRVVISIDVEEGTRVNAGDTLVTLASENLGADIAQAQATLKQRRDDFNAFSALLRTRDIGENTVTQARAALKQAQATLSALKQDQDFLRVQAPFTGYVNSIPVREGDVVEKNKTVLAQLFDPSTYIIAGNIPERLLSRVDRDANVEARGADGSVYQTRISYVGAEADAMTRTFPLEAKVSVPDETSDIMPAGVTFTLHMPLKQANAHFIPASALALDNTGRIGVKVKEKNKAKFYSVSIIDSGSDSGSIHVEGLPSSADIIVVGHAYIKEGADLSGVVLSEPL